MPRGSRILSRMIVKLLFDRKQMRLLNQYSLMLCRTRVALQIVVFGWEGGLEGPYNLNGSTLRVVHLTT